MRCHECIVAASSKTTLPPFSRSTVLLRWIIHGFCALLGVGSWSLVWWAIRSQSLLGGVLGGGFIAFILTWVALWGITIWWRKYRYRNVIARYQWYRVEPATGVAHQHLNPRMAGVEFRIPISGWKATWAVFLDGYEISTWKIQPSLKGPGYVLRHGYSDKEASGSICHQNLAFLMKIVAERKRFPYLLEKLYQRNAELGKAEAALNNAGHTLKDLSRLVAREEGLFVCFAVLTALREVMQSPQYARSPYAKLICDFLTDHVFDPSPLWSIDVVNDPNFQRMLDDWRAGLLMRAEDVLPKRKVAVAPTP